jgi:hypothetical protein
MAIGGSEGNNINASGRRLVPSANRNNHAATQHQTWRRNIDSAASGLLSIADKSAPASRRVSQASAVIANHNLRRVEA